MAEAKTTILKVFHNTGHHFFTVPLAELLAGKNEAFLLKLVESNRGAFEVWSPYTPWIRYQYDRTEREGTPIIKIAVESNLGLPDRGFLYDVREHSARPEAPESYSPYACDDEAQLVQFFPDRMLDLLNLPNKEGLDLPIKCRVYFAAPAGAQPVDVDLIVDLGNTRTAALLLESPGQQAIPLERRVWPLRVVARGNQFAMSAETREIVGSMARVGASHDDCAVFDSWLLLHRTLFAHLEPPQSERKAYVEWEELYSENLGRSICREKRFMPHAFLELSPALIGGGKSLDGATKTFARLPLNSNDRFYLSSPKRYVWSSELTGFRGGTFWKQIPNPTDPSPPDTFVDLHGLFRYFMVPAEGEVPGQRDITLEQLKAHGQPIVFPNTPATYPLRDAVCWFAMSLIEAAYRQINALAYLDAGGRNNLPRRLRNIRVTYPAGWTYQEREAYLGQWERAIRLFGMTHLEHPDPIDPHGQGGGDCPVFVTNHLDEAVCSQLPILYADIKSLFNDGDSWINLYGNEGSVVVMNLDIGGGTSDLAIIQYRNKGGADAVALRSKLLFRDGHPIAGDMLVKAIIEKVLLPAWVKASDTGQYQKVPSAQDWLTLLFKMPTYRDITAVDPFVQQKLMRVIRLVFVPLVNEWLQRLTLLAESAENSPWEPLYVKDCVAAEMIDGQTLNDLNELCAKVVQRKCPGAATWRHKVFADEARLFCKPEDLEACIELVFSDMFNHLGDLAARFKCQLLIVAGKPSELPRVRQLVLRSFPLMPQRIIQVKNFPAGRWYPFASEEGKIRDAKTCTVVGAALHQDMCNGHLENFSISDESTETFTRNCFWGVMPAGGMPGDFYKSSNLLFSPRDYPEAPMGSRQTDRISVEKEFVLPMNCRIGRQILRMKDIRPAPVYKLTWKPSHNGPAEHVRARVRLRWVSILGKGDKLELVENGVKPLEGYPPVQPGEVKLQLNTLVEDCFWMDDPRLDVDNLFGPRK
jgi:hypothetical protein